MKSTPGLSLLAFTLVFLPTSCGQQTEGEPTEPVRPTVPNESPSTTNTPVFRGEPVAPSVPVHVLAQCSSLLPRNSRLVASGQCSGPYTIPDIEFHKTKNALLINLELRVNQLPGNRTNRHATVLYSSAGITNQDLNKAKDEYLKWQLLRRNSGHISFYLGFLSGGKSEKILGELYDLIVFIRNAFPNDKHPQGSFATIHIALYQ